MSLDGAKTVAEARSRGVGGDRLRPLLRARARRQRRRARRRAACEPLGVVVVAPPWNFPLSIPGRRRARRARRRQRRDPEAGAGGRAGRLASRRRRCGTPASRRDRSQFLPCPDDEVGRGADHRSARRRRDPHRRVRDRAPVPRLAARPARSSPRRAARTPSSSRRWPTAIRPSATWCARPSATTARSARRRASAICEAEVYDDPVFRRQLRDAAASLPVGSAWDLREPRHAAHPAARAPPPPRADHARRRARSGCSSRAGSTTTATSGRPASSSACAAGRSSTSPSASARCSA